MTTCIALPVSLQRYFEVPPLAVRQRALATALARAEGARIVVLSSEAQLGTVPQAQPLAEKLALFASTIVDVDVSFRVLSGRPSDAVVDAVAEEGCDLAIIGSHAKHGAIELPFGTTTHSLLATLACAVVVVRPTPEEALAARRMLVPSYPVVMPYL
ncbi:MAG TPA: universal stress protein [Myxococcota bacterium]|jgi:nucleotide-binding universal stress UspA family protein